MCMCWGSQVYIVHIFLEAVFFDLPSKRSFSLSFWWFIFGNVFTSVPFPCNRVEMSFIRNNIFCLVYFQMWWGPQTCVVHNIWREGDGVFGFGYLYSGTIHEDRPMSVLDWKLSIGPQTHSFEPTSFSFGSILQLVRISCTPRYCPVCLKLKMRIFIIFYLNFFFLIIWDA